MNDSKGTPEHRASNTRVAIVTGSTSGAGPALAEALLERGYKVACVGADEGRLRALQDRVDQSGTSSLFLQANALKTDEVGETVEMVKKHWERIDVLVHNPGATPLDEVLAGGVDFMSVPEQALHHRLAGNLRAAFLCSRTVIPGMREAGGGSIVLISGENASFGEEGDVCTLAANAGMEAFGRKISAELRDDGIKVSMVRTGAGSSSAGGPLPPDEVAATVAELLRPGTDTWTREVVVAPLGKRAAAAGEGPKVFAVTRVHSLLGRSLAEAFLRAGYRVAGFDTERHLGLLPEIARLAELGGDSFMGVPCDMSDEQSIHEAVESVRNSWAAIDVLAVNVGASAPAASLEQATPEQWSKVMDVGARGAFLFAREALPGMRERGRGQVFMVSHHPGAEYDPSQPLSGLGRLGVGGLAVSFGADASADGVAVTELVLGAVGPETQDLPEDQRLSGERSCAIPASELGRTLIDVCGRGPDLHIKKLVLTGYRSRREEPEAQRKEPEEPVEAPEDVEEQGQTGPEEATAPEPTPEDTAAEQAAALLTTAFSAALPGRFVTPGHGKLTTLDGATVFEIEIAGPQDQVSTVVYLKAGGPGDPGFIRAGRLVLMHAGSHIDSLHAQVLKAMMPRLSRLEDRLVELLATG
jgi:NAD(P)-dependent dehydrogenase (short-subunit alcohol dehydrogenase family)